MQRKLHGIKNIFLLLFMWKLILDTSYGERTFDPIECCLWLQSNIESLGPTYNIDLFSF